MNGVELNLSNITSTEMMSLEHPEVSSMYQILFGAEEIESTNERGERSSEQLEDILSPYEIDRYKTIFRTRQQVVVKPTSIDKDIYQYDLNMSRSKKSEHVMDLASKIFLHDTIPAVKVKEEFVNNTQICHCHYPGHVKIDNAHLYHGSDLAGNLDNVTLDQYAQFSIPENRRSFYRRMVGDIDEYTTWGRDFPSFTVSVPQPWYFCTIPGAELRLNSKTQTRLTYVYRGDPTATLRMRIRDDENAEYKEVNIEDYLDRIIIQPVSNKKSSLELHMVLHKCQKDYVTQLEKSEIKIPTEDVIILDSTGDNNSHTIAIDTFDFIRRICILVEPKALPNKSIYNDAIVSGKLEYKGGLKKIPEFSPAKLLYDDIWSSSYSLPDRQEFYMHTISDHNKPGLYDAAMSLGSTGSKLTIVLNKSNIYDIRVRLYVYRIITYVDGEIRVITSLNSKEFTSKEE